MTHVYLIGFMGAGKSTVGTMVAAELDRPFVDLDARIEAASGRSVREIFEDAGEQAFRAIETSALESLAEEPPSIVACGGGVVLRDANRAFLKRTGLVVYLKVTAAETLARVGADGTRPLLSGPGGALAATALLEARESLYRAVADVTVETVDVEPEAVARIVADTVREREEA